MEIIIRLIDILKGKSGTLKDRIFCTISIVTGIMATDGYQNVMNGFLEKVSNKNSVFRGVTLNFADGATAAHNSIVDVLYKCTSENWNLLQDTFSNFSDVIANTHHAVEHFNNFLGVSIVYSPKAVIGTGFREGHALFVIIGILIPVISTLSGATMYIALDIF